MGTFHADKVAAVASNQVILMIKLVVYSKSMDLTV